MVLLMEYSCSENHPAPKINKMIEFYDHNENFFLILFDVERFFQSCTLLNRNKFGFLISTESTLHLIWGIS